MKNEEHLYMQFHINLLDFLLFMKNKKVIK